MQTRLAAFVPEIPASSVAAVIGLHTYKTPYEAMYAILKKDAITKERIRALEQTHDRVSLDTMRRKVAASPGVYSAVRYGLDQSRTASSTEDLDAIVEEAKRNIGFVVASQFPSLPPEVQSSIVNECASDIHKQRGTKNENAVLNQYEARTKTQVTERNTCMRYANCGAYKLCGRIDGYVASLNRVVDSKERRVHWPTPPVYDEIQLRVYMELMGCPEAELVERFPNGETRHTLYERDPEKWGRVHEGLVKAAQTMVAATTDDAVLLRIINANTFKGSGSSTPNASHSTVNYII